jgi:hypothetical protein
MPLQHSSSPSAFKTNVRTLMDERGKSPHVKNKDQALAIAYAIKRRGKAMGGGMAFGGMPSVGPENANWRVKQEARGMTHSFAGPINSAVPGRTDRHEMKIGSGGYVIPAQAVSHLGQSNTAAGFKTLNGMFGPGGKYWGSGPKLGGGAGAPPAPRPPKMAGIKRGGSLDNGGARGEADQGKPVDVVTAGGEYVIPPHVVHNIGLPIARMHGGDPVTHGHNALDQWVNKIKRDHIATLKKLPGPAKS